MKETWKITSWEEYRQALRTMQRKSKLFEVTKEELTKRGHWKRKPRGHYPKSS